MDNKPLTLLILHGKGAGNDDLREAITTLREEGFDIAVRVTFEKGDGDRYVKEAIALQAETVVAGGGDGTINEVATALAASSADHRPVLGILPLGTANDFATSVGIPEEMEPALTGDSGQSQCHRSGQGKPEPLLHQYGDRRVWHPYHD